jgi:hypothetical protein
MAQALTAQRLEDLGELAAVDLAVLMDLEPADLVVLVKTSQSRLAL